jgi:hypothetical protein
MRNIIVPVLLSAIALGSLVGVAQASADGPLTDVTGTYRVIGENNIAGPWLRATSDPEDTVLTLRLGQRVEVIGAGSSCLDPVTQQRHIADDGPLGGHQAECHVTPEGVPASWAR